MRRGFSTLLIGVPAEAVVTDTGELWAEVPAESVAATVKL